MADDKMSAEELANARRAWDAMQANPKAPGIERIAYRHFGAMLDYIEALTARALKAEGEVEKLRKPRALCLYDSHNSNDRIASLLRAASQGEEGITVLDAKQLADDIADLKREADRMRGALPSDRVLNTLLTCVTREGNNMQMSALPMERVNEASEALGKLRATLSHQADDALSGKPASFQSRVQPWLMECFGAEIAADELERDDRFLEEALELVQAGRRYTADRAHSLVDYVFGRPAGDFNQEVGGVMLTLAANCLARGADMHAAGETELARVWTKVEQIRAKQAAKPKGSALPIAVALPPDAGAVTGSDERLREALIKEAHDHPPRTAGRAVMARAHRARMVRAMEAVRAGTKPRDAASSAGVTLSYLYRALSAAGVPLPSSKRRRVRRPAPGDRVRLADGRMGTICAGVRSSDQFAYVMPDDLTRVARFEIRHQGGQKDG